MIEVHPVDRLVGADIAGADDNQFWRKRLDDALVCLELFILRRFFGAAEIDKLRAEETDALGVVLLHGTDILRTADVRKNLDCPAVDGGVGLALEFLKKSLFLEVLVVFCGECVDEVLRRLYVNTGIVAVENGELAVPAVVDLFALDESWRVHGAGEDSRVAVRRALACDHAEKLGLVELDGVGRRKVFGDENTRLSSLHGFRIIPEKDIKNAVSYINDIGAAGLEVRVVHLFEHLCHVREALFHGIFSGVLLVGDDGLHGIIEVIIVEHLCVEFEDAGTVFAGGFDCLFIQRILLFLRLHSGLLVTIELGNRILHETVTDFIRRRLENFDFADRNPIQD